MARARGSGDRLFAVLFLVMLAACAAATIWARGAT